MTTIDPAKVATYTYTPPHNGPAPAGQYVPVGIRVVLDARLRRGSMKVSLVRGIARVHPDTELADLVAHYPGITFTLTPKARKDFR